MKPQPAEKDEPHVWPLPHHDAARDIEEDFAPEELPEDILGSATLENVGPDREAYAPIDEDDALEGTTSGTGNRGKPPRGSIGRGSY